MNASPAAPAAAPTTDTERPAPPRKVLCAYSPRWLSGPTPGYRGLCATWEGDTPTTEHPAFRAN
jgi:hypothetical protein